MESILSIILFLITFLLSSNTSLSVNDIKTITRLIAPSPTHAPLPPQFARVTKVIDGDTIEIEGGKQVRYIGIDTPETKHPTKGIQCFGREASQKNKELIEGKTVKMEKDISETDRYGRLLRYVYVQEPTATSAALFVNEYLVTEGYAYAVTFPPDVRLADHFSKLQHQAVEQKKGLWGICQ